MSSHARSELSVDDLWQTARSAPILTAEKECALAYAAQAGSSEAFNALLKSYFRLVVYIAREHRSFGLPLEEVVSEGLLGLVKAARRFDPSRGVRLAAYAVWWIRAYVRRYTIKNRRIVCVPSARSDRKLLAGLRRTQRMLTQVNGEPPQADQVAEALGVNVRSVEQMEAVLSGRDVSFSGYVDGDGLQIACDTPSPEALIGEKQDGERIRRSVRAALSKLSPREQRVVELRFLGPESTTLAYIGRSMGISRERVRQIERRAVERIRDAVGADGVGRSTGRVVQRA